MSPPIEINWLGLAFASIIILILFTGTYDINKHRVALTISYLLIVLVIAAPFLFLNKSNLSKISDSPVCILKVDKNLQSDGEINIRQWALNIGGNIMNVDDPLDTAQNKGADMADVSGGLVIPIYILVLAIFGGAVRMAQNIPKIQGGEIALNIVPQGIIDVLTLRKLPGLSSTEQAADPATTDAEPVAADQ